MGTTTIKKSEADKAYRESDDSKSPEPKLNGVVLDHLRKVRGEQEDVFECHKYELTMNDLEKLLAWTSRHMTAIAIKTILYYAMYFYGR